MHTTELNNIELGEIVIFSPSETYAKRIGRLTDNYRGFKVRYQVTNNRELWSMAVALRPLVLEPLRRSYIFIQYHGEEKQLDRLYERISDCLDLYPLNFEFLDIDSFSGFGPTKKTQNDRICENSEFRATLLDIEPDAIPGSAKFAAPCTDDISEEEDIDNALAFDQKNWLDRLSALVLEYVAANHEMPPQEIINSVIKGKLQIYSVEELSPIVVNSDMRIILPAYNELELRMTPLARTVYILFLCHPEGIILKNIGDYHDELREIYLLVKPGADSDLADRYIQELTYPGSDSLQQKLSLIKKSISRYLIPERLAKQYTITGLRGKEYRIDIPADKITLPRVIRK